MCRRTGISLYLTFQQSHMANLEGQRLAHDLEQLPGFGCYSALTFQFRDPGFLHTNALLAVSRKTFGAGKHSIDDCSRMWLHVRNTTTVSDRRFRFGRNKLARKKGGTTVTKIRSLGMSTETSDQVNACFAKAVECERRAMLVPDETHRKTYSELARLWRDMAEQVEGLDRRLSQERRQERSRITFRPRSAAR